ncbi:hypothetical protein SAMN05192575_10660 [Nocardioides alpinus]|uniref:Uncharacterized protein n=1 Tax=Nocardioides alpinus TaxID=748909 RepID=A0A1I0ZM57_9ACTN|nr:hypothetical protein [Nocardioides alpinus]PKH41944.1 hypothetical protein CXG46_08845 [Nocardioides alpinus]SFB26581.1 hypothetical protein SAMN05192575_10660 [Nocardioides alpinus]
MKLFADTPVRRTVQVLVDLLFVAWLVLWVWIGMAVHDGTMELAGPARQTDSAATSMAEQLRDAGGRLGEAPLVGDELSVPFDKAADASDGIASAGRDTVDAVERLALLLGLSVALIPILIVAVIHLPLRWRFIREATAGARFIDAHEDLDLFALRALAHQPMRVLARVSDDPAGAWRAQDPEVVRRLAELELADVGLRPKRMPAA